MYFDGIRGDVPWSTARPRRIKDSFSNRSASAISAAWMLLKLASLKKEAEKKKKKQKHVTNVEEKREKKRRLPFFLLAFNFKWITANHGSNRSFDFSHCSL